MGLFSRVQRPGGAPLKELGVELQFYVKVRNLERNFVRNPCEGNKLSELHAMYLSKLPVDAIMQ